MITFLGTPNYGVQIHYFFFSAKYKKYIVLVF